jgi:hypothetical protein
LPFDFGHKSAPGGNELLFAPVLWVDDGVAAEDSADPTAQKLHFVKLQSREAVNHPARIAQQNDPILLQLIRFKASSIDMQVELGEQLIEPVHQGSIDRASRQHSSA